MKRFFNNFKIRNPQSEIRNSFSLLFFKFAIRNPQSEIRNFFFSFAILCGGLLTTLNAQTPEWVYQHESPYPIAIAVDSFGNTYTTGCISRNDTNGFGVIALDSGGNFRWLFFNDTLADWAYGNDIIFNSGWIYIGGYVQFANGNEDLVVACIDTAGQVQWIYRDTISREANAIAVSQARSIYVAGFTRISSLDIIVLKLDSLGNEVWRYVYDGPAGSYDKANSIVIDADENIYVGGYSTGFGTNTDFTIIKLDSAGQEQWVYRYDGPASYRDEPEALVLDSLGNLYITGWSWGIDWDFCVVKIDTAGQEKWVYRYNGQANSGDLVYDMVLDDSGNVYVCGSSMDTDTIDLFTIIKVDSSGQEKWCYKTSGPSGRGGIANSLVLDGLSGIYAGGFFRNISFRPQIAVVKLQASGDTLWTYIYPHIPPSPWGDVVHDVVADINGNVYVAGRICVSPWNDDIVVMKFASGQGKVKEVVGNEVVVKNHRATISKGGIEFLPQEDCGIKVYDVMGRLVVNRILRSGKKEIIKLQPGVYFLRVEGEKERGIRKVIIL